MQLCFVVYQITVRPPPAEKKEMRSKKQRSDRKMGRCCAAGFRDGGRGQEPRKLEKAREWVIWSLQKVH